MAFWAVFPTRAVLPGELISASVTSQRPQHLGINYPAMLSLVGLEVKLPDRWKAWSPPGFGDRVVAIGTRKINRFHIPLFINSPEIKRTVT